MLQINYRSKFVILAALGLIAAFSILAVPRAQAGFNLGDATNFVALQGGSSQFTANSSNITGNIGVGGTGEFAATGPGSLSGNLYFAQTPNQSMSNITFNGTVHGNSSNVATDLTNLGTLSSNLGGESGTALSVNLSHSGSSQTINASSGKLDANGDRVFDINSFNFSSGSTLTIQGDGAGDSVVLNFSSNVSFAGTIILSGLTDDQVLFNVTGGKSLTVSGANLQGDFLDSNGSIQVSNSTLEGRLFGGDNNNMKIVSTMCNMPSPPGQTHSVPEPSSLAVLALGLLSLIVISSRRTSLVVNYVT